jgi:hypothetical protein
MSFGTGDIAKHLISALIPSTTSPLISGVIAASSAVDAGLISEFTFTAGQVTFDGKNFTRGFSKSGSNAALNYGSTTATTLAIGSGATASLTTTGGSGMGFVGSSFSEFDPQSGNHRVNIILFFSGQSAPATINDANYFKSVKFINHTQSTEHTLQRSYFANQTVIPDAQGGSDSRTQFLGNQAVSTGTIGIAQNDSITFQLRSD